MRAVPPTSTTSPLAVMIRSPVALSCSYSSSLSSASCSVEPASMLLAGTPSSRRCSTMRRTSSTMSKRLLMRRSRPEVSTVAGAAGTGVGAGARVAATLGTLCWLLIRARVGPGEMVHASSSVSKPCSGNGTCSTATLASIFRRSSLIDWSALLFPPEFPLNGHAM